ncbi:MAG: hypothetical protein ABFC77_15680 [Thermoguttaceae bacterium]
MGKSTKTPKAPDYASLANQQAALGKESWSAALQANRPNQQNQFGSLSWSQDPTTGQWTQTSALNQPQQDIFNQQQANQQQIANMAGGMLGGFDTSQIDFSGVPQAPTVGQFNQQATDLYNQLAEPGLANAENAQRARAAAMGLPEFGSRAGTTMNQQLADARARSGMMGAQAGIQQGNQMFNQQMGLRQQGISDILQQRGANLAQMQGLMGLGQSMGTPQFNQFGQTGAYNTPDLMGAAQGNYNAQMDKANAGNADRSNTLSTIGTVAGVAAAFGF